MRDSDPLIDEILGKGVDPQFDKIVASLGYIARHKPKPVIDSVMFWRKSKAEAASSFAQALESATTAAKQHNDHKSSHSHGGSRVVDVDVVSQEARENAIHADKKSLISIYILCRVLMDIVNQTPPQILGDDLSEKLEEIVYKQLKTADSHTLSHNNIRRSNWNLFAELLGEMSRDRFASVGDRFIADLEKLPDSPPKETEANARLIVVGMKFLKLKLYPMDSLEESAEFLESIAKFFGRSQSQTLKIAYSDVLTQILMPLAGPATAELNHPVWSRAIELLYSKASQMMQKPKYWFTAYPLASVLLCVAPQEMFTDLWMSFFDQSTLKLKDRANKVVLYTGSTRLLWVFAFRWTESLNNTTKKLDTIVRTLLTPTSRKAWSASAVEKGTLTSCISIIRIGAHAYLQYILENVLFQMLIGSTGTSDSVILEHVLPERSIIAIKAFIYILNDIDSKQKPEFPTPDVLRSMAKSPTPQPKGQPRPNNTVKPFHDRFCRVIGKLALLLDTQVGTQAMLLEQQPQSTKPMAVSFHFGNDNNNNQALKQGYLELYRVVIDAIPWCLPADSSMTKSMVEILGKNVVHSHRSISEAAIRSLKCLARTKDTRNIISTYIKMVFAMDEKLLANSEAPLTASSDFEKVLRIYVELLEVWIENIVSSNAAKNAANEDGDDNNLNGTDTEAEKQREDILLSNVWPSIEEVEGNGLFFLCSQDRSIRHLAMKILKLTLKFDAAVSDKENQSSKTHSRQPSAASQIVPTRIIQFMESADITFLFDSAKPEVQLSVPERSRLMKLHGRKKENLVRLAESDYGVDAALWIKAFPLFIKECFDKYPMPVAICRNIVCIRLVRMYDVVVDFTRSELAAIGPASHSFILKHPMRTHPEVVVEQWRIFLVIACATLTLTDEQKLHIPDAKYQHGRKKSVQKVTIHHQRITSVRSVFRMVIPLLGIGHPVIRDAIVNGISSINVNIYKTLLECLSPAFEEWKEKVKKSSGTSSGAFSSTSAAMSSLSRQTAGIGIRRESGASYRADRVITEIANILCVTSHYLDVKEIIEDEWIVTELVSYLNELRSLLSQNDVQIDYNYSKLRRYFCTLLDSVYSGLYANTTRTNPIGFESRMKFFILVNGWCQFGRGSHAAKDREEVVKRNALSTCRDSREHNMVLASFELEKRKLESAVISALAALCLGSVTHTEENNASKGTTLALNVNGLLYNIKSIFKSTREELHVLGRKTLKNLLITNPENSAILEEAVANGYESHEQAKSSDSFFATICEVFESDPNYPCQIRQPFCLGLFKIGSEDLEIRRLAVQLLKCIELRFYGASCLKEYEISITSPTMAVYKRAMFNLSAKFAKIHTQEAYMVFSELTKFFHLVDDLSRRDILTVLLPWIQCVELQTESHNDHPTPASTLVMNNLFQITVAFSEKIQNEVEGLWVALANGGYPSNVNVILDFILHYCLQRRDPQFMRYCGKILVHLAATPAGSSLIPSLQAYLQPKSMIPMHPEPYDVTVAEAVYPYVADIKEILPATGKEASFSKGQIAMVLLVNLTCGQDETLSLNVPLLLHIAFALFDHYVPIVHGQAKQLLIHIIHELSDYSDSALELCEEIRRADYSTWSYDSLNNDKSGARAPKVMVDLVGQVISVFEEKIPDLKQQWAKVALQWATTCPVRHIACRSFQIFRCLLTCIDQNMLADMLARLSNTIADNSQEIQGFAMQILMTLNAIAAELPGDALMNCPQLFWSTVACMGTIHEQEFIESLSILEKYLNKVDLDSPNTVANLIQTFPPKWEGNFSGLQRLVIPGLSSSVAYDQSLRVLNLLNRLQPSEIVAGEDQLVLAIMSNVPRLLHAVDKNSSDTEMEICCHQLIAMCEADPGNSERMTGLVRILNSVSKKRFRSKEDLLKQTVQQIQANFFPKYEVTILIFFLGILSNKIRWIKEETMEVLKLILPVVDMQREEFAGIGADIISPLLRLLQTDYAEEALSVLDTAVSIPASQMDKHVLRMSLGNRAIRKEYERTATLFGIPDDSGWAVPMPAVTSSIVRNNVHAVFYTCGNSTHVNIADDSESDVITVGTISAVPEDFQFHKDEYGFYPGGGFERQDSVSVAEGDFEASSLTNMWTALDNLDSFFTRDMKRASKRASGKGNAANGSIGAREGRSPLSADLSGIHSGQESPNILGSGVTSRGKSYMNTSRFRNRFRMDQKNSGLETDTVATSMLNEDEHRGIALSSPTDLSRNNSISLDHRNLLHNVPDTRFGRHQHNFSITDTDTSTDIAMDPVENVPQLYDKKVSLILNRSLARTPSTTSFKTYLADSFGNSPLTPTTSDAYRQPQLASTGRIGGSQRLVPSMSHSGDYISSSDNETGPTNSSTLRQGTAMAAEDNAHIKTQSVLVPPHHIGMRSESASSSNFSPSSDTSTGNVSYVGGQEMSVSFASPPPQRPAVVQQESSFRLDSFLRASHLRKGKKKEKEKEKAKLEKQTEDSQSETGTIFSDTTSTTVVEDSRPARKVSKEKEKRKRSLSRSGTKPTSLASSIVGKFGGASSPSSAKSNSPQLSPASNSSSPSTAAAAAALSGAYGKRHPMSPSKKGAMTAGLRSPTPPPRRARRPES